MLRDQKVSIKAGKTEQIFTNAEYLRVKTALIPFRFKSKNGDDFEIKQGDEANIKGFDYIYIQNESATDQVIDFYTGDADEKVGSAELSGSVAVTNQAPLRGAMTQNRASLTNVNQAIILANVNRNYLLIQNNDTSAIMRVSVSGAPAAVASGFRIKAGDSLELRGFVPTGAINVIMETASAVASNVEYAEG